MATYTYEQIYSDPKKAIIRSSSDAALVGLRNGQEVSVVCDRKWGEFTPAYEEVLARLTDSSQSFGEIVLLTVGGSYVLYDSTKTYTVLHLYGADGVTPVVHEQHFVNASSLGAFSASYPDRLCFKQTYGSTFATYVKYRVERAQS